MTDARYPESWLNDRRIVKLSDAGHRLFVTSMALAASNRTDGLLDDFDLEMLRGADPRHATELVTAGLWAKHGDGWQIVDFLRTQSSKAQLDGLDHKRQQDRQRQANKRARDRGQGPIDEDLSRDVTPVTEDVTSAVTQRQGQDRTGKASTERPPSARQSSVDDSFYGRRPECPHGKPGGLEPDDFVGGNRASCPECAMEAAS